MKEIVGVCISLIPCAVDSTSLTHEWRNFTPKKHQTECVSLKRGGLYLTEHKMEASFSGTLVDTNTRASHTSAIELDWK
jgi:hypothetical protein